ncbi:MAG: ROK family protein [Candidatus Bathyarchaeota archaeon]|nr:ROK family protein [Candidatus Bathyarchaeota archaeon]
MVEKMDAPLSLGVDLGGSKINVGLVDASGNVLVSHKSLLSSKSPDAVFDDISAGIEVCYSKTGKQAAALGVGVAAQVDEKGVVRGSPNLGWRKVDVKKALEQKVGLPVFVTNDVRAATWGEWQFGSGRGVDDLVVLFVGTGVGGGVVSGGRLLSGCSNTGGELGHMTIVSGGRKCRCPNYGCLEAYAGGWAIAERTQEAIRTLSTQGKRLLLLAGSVSNVSSVTLNEAYRQGDLLSRLLVEETGKFLGAGVVSIVNAFNPCVVALGGGIIENIPELVSMVKDFVTDNALTAAVEPLSIVRAELGADAAVIGAACLAQDLVKNR